MCVWMCVCEKKYPSRQLMMTISIFSLAFFSGKISSLLFLCKENFLNHHHHHHCYEIFFGEYASLFHTFFVFKKNENYKKKKNERCHFFHLSFFPALAIVDFLFETKKNNNNQKKKRNKWKVFISIYKITWIIIELFSKEETFLSLSLLYFSFDSFIRL